VSSNPTRVFRCYVHVLKAKQIRYSDALADRYSLNGAQTMNGATGPRPALSTRSRAQRPRLSNSLLLLARLPHAPQDRASIERK
jgi:hypothetical protein